MSDDTVFGIVAGVYIFGVIAIHAVAMGLGYEDIKNPSDDIGMVAGCWPMIVVVILAIPFAIVMIVPFFVTGYPIYRLARLFRKD